MRSKQSGVTMIGWILLLIPVALCVYTAIRLTPVYLNYMKVVRTLNQIQTEFKDADAGSPQAIRTALEKRLFIEECDYPDAKDFKITRDGKSWVVGATYDDQAPLFSNVFILVSFDKQVTLNSGGGTE